MAGQHTARCPAEPPPSRRAAAQSRPTWAAAHSLAGSAVAYPDANPARRGTWTVPCQDAVGRPRTVQVRRDPHDVTLGLPAGESARLGRLGVMDLIAVVDAAITHRAAAR